MRYRGVLSASILERSAPTSTRSEPTLAVGLRQKISLRVLLFTSLPQARFHHPAIHR